MRTRTPPTRIAVRLRAAGCVYAEDEAAILVESAADEVHLETLVGRREGGEPLETIVGWAEFLGRRLVVEPGVFVPRRRTEFLAELAIAIVRPGAVVVDVACGCGAIGAAIGDAVDGASLYAVDIDPVAVRCAARNLSRVGGVVIEGDLMSSLPVSLRGNVDVLVANVPYVPSDMIRLMPPEARLYEPARALDGGADGLAVARRLVRQAPPWLAPEARVLVETSHQQSDALAAELAAAGFEPAIHSSDDHDATVAVGVWIGHPCSHPAR